jgi:hypothetical protein
MPSHSAFSSDIKSLGGVLFPTSGFSFEIYQDAKSALKFWNTTHQSRAEAIRLETVQKRTGAGGGGSSLFGFEMLNDRGGGGGDNQKHIVQDLCQSTELLSPLQLITMYRKKYL